MIVKVQNQFTLHQVISGFVEMMNAMTSASTYDIKVDLAYRCY